MERCGSIYKIVNLVNGKIYIGQTIQRINARWMAHKKPSNKNPIGDAIKKYGLENFTIEEIASCTDMLDLNFAEQIIIAQYDCLVPKGYNLIEGGRNSYKSDKMKTSVIPPSFKGKRHTEKTKLKISESLKMYDAISKNSRCTQRKYTEEGRQKRREQLTGKGNPFHGKKHSEISKLKNKLSQKMKPIIGTNLETKGEIKFECLMDATRAKFYKSSIIAHIKNGKPYKGFIWRFIDEKEN